MSTSITATQVAAAYTAILRVAPPGGSTGAYTTSVAAQINQGQLSLGNFESSLIGLDQTVYTTLAGLVTIDAFYNASPASATLTTVAAATSGTSYTTAVELHTEGYSDANVWTVLGSGWGADPTSNFFTLYNGQATGNTNDYSTAINSMYQHLFGTLPTAANLQNLINDIPGVGQLLSGGGHTATPIQILGGIYGYLLYTAQVNSIGIYATKANTFLAMAATDEVNSPGSSSTLYGPEISTNPVLGTTPGQTNVFLTTANDNVTGTAIFGSLTPFSINGVGPTLNATDIINGSPGSTNNTLTISDDFATGNDQIPVGTTINNIQNVVLQTAGNAGGTGLFDTTAYPSVTSVTINASGGGVDNVRVANATNLTVNHLDTSAGAVTTVGGNNVTVTNNGPGATTIGNTVNTNANPTGAVVVNAVSGAVGVLGGTTVNVNVTGISAGVVIGVAGFSVSPAEPSGAVTVNAPATSSVAVGTAITVFGGASTNLTSGGGVVTVGALIGQTVFSAAGNDTVVDNAAVARTYNYVTGATNGVALGGGNAVTILGGAAVNVTTNAGGAIIGQPVATAFNGTVLTPGLEPSGNVTVSDTADLSVAHGGIGTPVVVYSGVNVAVTDAGSAVQVGDPLSAAGTVIAPSGTVSVTDNAQVTHDGIVNTDNNKVTTVGGTAVTVTTNAGDVTVGLPAGAAGTEPSGNITITDTGNDSVTSYGGANVTIAATNGPVLVGTAAGSAATNPTGNVSVTETGLLTGGAIVGTGVSVNGGVNVTIATTGGGGNAGTKGTPITGTVVITDTQVGPSADAFTVIGGNATSGNSVSITETASSGAVTVGVAGAATLNAAGTALAKPSDYANGTVSIVDESPAGTNPAGSSAVFGTGAISVNTDGATAVTIAGGGSATVVDEQTTPATGGASAGSPIGTSTLTTVSLDGIGAGASTLTSGVLANVTVLDSAKAAPSNVTIVSPAALALTLGNDTNATLITDTKTTGITVTTSGTASSGFQLNAPAATALTFNNTAAVTLGASAGVFSNDAAVKTITISGSGAVTLPDFSAAFGATTADGALTSINATGSSGAITVGGISVFQTAFTPGTGADTITIVNNPNPGVGQTVQKITGATGSTLTANYVAAATDQALHSVNAISGFSTLGLGTAANSTVGPFVGKFLFNPYDAGGFGTLTVGQIAGAVTFSDVGSGTTNLAITSSQGAGNTPGAAVSLLLNDPVAEGDVLAMTVGANTTTLTTPITTTINIATDTFTGGKASLGTFNVVNVNSLDPSTISGTNTVTINDSITSTSGLPNAGTSIIGISGDFAAKVIYNVAGAPTVSSVGNIVDTDTGAVDVTGVALSPGGATFTGGAGKLTAFGSSELGGADNTKALDTFTTGAGGGVYTIGAGGGWNVGLATKTAPLGGNDSGNETINLSASTAVSDTVNVGPAVVSIANGAGVGGITGFQAIASAKTADVIGMTGTGSNGALAGNGLAGIAGYSVMANAAANNSSPVGLQNVSAFIINTGINANATLKADLAGLDPNSLLANLTFSSSNGVITFGAVAGNNINQFNPTQLLTAAEGIVSEEAFITGQDQVAVFTAAFAGLSANTFIVASDMYTNKVTTGAPLIANIGHIYGATEIELNGVSSGITGVGATAAGNVVEMTGVSQVVPGATAALSIFTRANGGTGNLGTVAGTTFNDAGFSEDTLGAAGSASTNTYNNLGGFAQIDIVTPANEGALVVGAQTGTAGQDSLVVNFASSGGAATLANLTVTSDDLVTITTTPGALDTITSFTDAGGTVASLVVNGTGSLTITNTISDATLTSIDAHGLAGVLSLSVTETVSINGALGGDLLSASGAGDTISVGSTANAITGSVELTANAAGDTVTLTHEAGGSVNFIAAASGTDTITVDQGNNALGGTFNLPPAPGDTFATSLGAGDTINLHSGSTFGAAATDFAWVGSGTTVNLGTSTTAWGNAAAPGDNATVAVMGDLTGATSGNSPAMTVITGFNPGNANGNLWLQFDGSQVAHTVPLTAAAIASLATSAPTFTWAGGTVAKAYVNEAGATSLASALDIAAGGAVTLDASAAAGHTAVANGAVQLAAHTGLTDWFQFGGNTYLVEALNTSGAAAAHTALAATDVVVELTGLVNVATAAGGHLFFV